MADILNLALKKDVFEGLNNDTTDIISIDNSKWWKKRLMDLDTGKFKNFDIARVSCGSADKIDYLIDKIELIDDKFIITIKKEIEEIPDSTDVIESDIIDSENANTEIVQPVDPINEKQERITLQKEINEYNDIPSKNEDVKQVIIKLLDEFCSNDNVYNIPTPYVMIRPNGQIAGTNKYLLADRNNESRIYFKDIEIIKYKNISDIDFSTYISSKMKELLRGNYVFIRRKECGFKKITSGEDVFVMRIAVRKTYNFRKI